MNVIYALSAYPAGAFTDGRSRLAPLALGLLLLFGADLALAAPYGGWAVALGVALWGLHMGLTQGLLATLVADVAAPELRGTAFGLFNLVGGVATLARQPSRRRALGQLRRRGGLSGERRLHSAGACRPRADTPPRAGAGRAA